MSGPVESGIQNIEKAARECVPSLVRKTERDFCQKAYQSCEIDYCSRTAVGIIRLVRWSISFYDLPDIVIPSGSGDLHHASTNWKKLITGISRFLTFINATLCHNSSGFLARRMPAAMAAGYCGEPTAEAFLKQVGIEYPQPRIKEGRRQLWLRDDLDRAIVPDLKPGDLAEDF